MLIFDKYKQIFFMCIAISYILIPISCENDDEEIFEGFQYLSSLDLGDEGAAEISAYNAKFNNLFVVNNSKESVVNVLSISANGSMSIKSSLNVSKIGGGINSVATKGEILAVAVEGYDKQSNGKIAIYSANSLQLLRVVEAGALPDMVVISADGRYIMSANEGEPSSDYLKDPDGSITVIDTQNDYKSYQLNFKEFDKQQLIAKGIRVFGPIASVAQDLEPEYITISKDAKTAWVTLQENNAIARIDLNRMKIVDIFALGYKNHSLSGNELDASDKDNGINIKNWPIFGMYQPDALGSFQKDSTNYLVTANEGDSRDYEQFSEEKRLNKMELDPLKFPNFEVLQKEENLGRLKITNTLGDADNDGDLDAIYAFGARSFSIWNGDNGKLVYDSGSDIEKITKQEANLFNNDLGETDQRSDDKGAEPEGVALMTIRDKQIACIGLERTGGVLVYDLSIPESPKFLQWLKHKGDFAPEGITLVSDTASPLGKALLIVSNEVSGTVSLYIAN